MQGYHGQGSCLRQAAKPSPINGTQSQFSCKKTIPLDMWDVKCNCAKGRIKALLIEPMQFCVALHRKLRIRLLSHSIYVYYCSTIIYNDFA